MDAATTPPSLASPSTVLITGAGTGFGRLAASMLADRGHNVVAGTLTEEEAIRLSEEDSRIDARKLDITVASDRNAVSAVPVDVLVNNAGVGQAGPLRSIPLDLVRAAFEVNVFGTLAMTQTVLPGMIARGRGRILVMSSVAGVLAGPITGTYSMTKHALQAMASAMRSELAEIGIDVALINPGPFATGFNDSMIDDSLAWFDPAGALPGEMRLIDDARRRITGAQLDPVDVARAIVDLVEVDTTELTNFIPVDIVDRIRRS